MMKHLLLGLLLSVMIAQTRAQSFPFEESFTTYSLGSTGAPAWTVLKDRWRVTDKTLEGPVTARFNRRMPQQFTVEIQVVGQAGARMQAGFYLNAPRDTDVASSDLLLLNTTASTGSIVQVETGAVGATVLRPDARSTFAAGTYPETPLRLRVVMDSETGRYAAFVGEDAVVKGAAAEYAGDVLALQIGPNTRVTRLTLREPTSSEREATQWGTLFNDPRDICADQEDGLLILHRSSPAISVMSPTGDISRSFGRRLLGHIPDAVALESGPDNQVYVLNRVPGEVVVFDRNGRIRRHFGSDRLKEPSGIALGKDGTVFVADPGSGRLVTFRATGEFLKDVQSFRGETGRPVHVSIDVLGNVLVGLEDPARTVTLRRESSGELAVVDVQPGLVYDAVSAEGRTIVSHSTGIRNWPVDSGSQDPVFRALAAEGLSTGTRMAASGTLVYGLDREHSRLVVVPPNLAEIQPTVQWANMAHTAATIRWKSAIPAARSRVRVLKGSTWDLVAQGLKESGVEHQILVDKLASDAPIRFHVSPSLKTIPQRDWSVDFLYDPTTDTVTLAPPRTAETTTGREEPRAPRTETP